MNYVSFSKVTSPKSVATVLSICLVGGHLRKSSLRAFIMMLKKVMPPSLFNIKSLQVSL